MTIDDLLAVKGVGDPQISPDGRSIVYVVSELDRATDKTNSSLWMVSTDGGEPRRLTTAPGTNNHPRWSPDGKSVAFVSSRGGSAQVWILPIDGGEARQVTKLPIDVAGPIWSPKGDKIAFAAEVYPGKTPEETADAGQGEGSREEQGSHLRSPDDPSLERLERGQEEPPVRRRRRHRRGRRPDPKLEVNTPPAPFGGSGDYAWSPRRREPGVRRRAAQGPRLVTNTDIWTVPATGGDAKNLTESNPAADGQPSFSPDGKYLAYIAQSKPALRVGPLGAPRPRPRNGRDDRRQLASRPPGSRVRLEDGRLARRRDRRPAGPCRSSRSRIRQARPRRPTGRRPAA